MVTETTDGHTYGFSNLGVDPAPTPHLLFGYDRWTVV